MELLSSIACAPLDTKNRGNRGAANELAVCAEFLRRGWPVFRAMSPHSPYDLVVDVDGELLRVEVKSVGKRDNSNQSITFHWPRGDSWDLLVVVSPSEMFMFRKGVDKATAIETLRGYPSWSDSNS